MSHGCCDSVLQEPGGLGQGSQQWRDPGGLWEVKTGPGRRREEQPARRMLPREMRCEVRARWQPLQTHSLLRRP